MVSYNRVQMMQVLLELYNEVKVKGKKTEDSKVANIEETLMFLAESVFDRLDEYIPIFIQLYNDYVIALEEAGEFNSVATEPITPSATTVQPTMPNQKQREVEAYKAGCKSGSTEMVDMMIGMYCAEALSGAITGNHQPIEPHIEHQQMNEFHDLMGGIDFNHH